VQVSDVALEVRGNERVESSRVESVKIVVLAGGSAQKPTSVVTIPTGSPLRAVAACTASYEARTVCTHEPWYFLDHVIDVDPHVVDIGEN
jgi:hypothetical protein